MVFSFSLAQYRAAWNLAIAELGFPERGPHVLRHSGASDLYAKGKPLAEIQIAGRWNTLSSVKRYTKTYLIAHFEASVPGAQLRNGARFWNTTARFLKQVRLFCVQSELAHMG